MISGFGGAALALLVGYLALFFWGSAVAARAAGKPVWLFARATGRDRLAAFGFRVAFILSGFGPLLWLALPMLHQFDPFRINGDIPALGLIGIFIAGLGAMVAFAAQMSMGTSWRVGVISGATGDLVSGGLYQVSRNPTFVGQCALLAGVALAVPSGPDTRSARPVRLVGRHTGPVGRGRTSPSLGGRLQPICRRCATLDRLAPKGAEP
jgi:drug/metabolite transporter (DMT)-like permease